MSEDTDKKINPYKIGLSIRHKIMLNVIFVLTMAIAANTYITVLAESKAFHESLIQKGQNTTNNIASSTKSAFWSLNWIFVENMINESANSDQKDTIYTKIVKPNGEIYLANKKKYYGKQVNSELLGPKNKVIKDHIFKDEENQKGILIVHPVPIGKDTWYILLGLSTAPIKHSLNQLIKKNIKLGGLLLLISAILSFLLSNSISKPIINLANATKIIADGGRDHFIEVKRRDEVGLLRDSFNKMIQSIKKAEKALIASNDRFITVLDSIDATIYVADFATYKILFMNRAMRDAFGTSHEGELCYQVFRRRNSPCKDCKNKKLIDNQGEPADLIVWEGHSQWSNRWFAIYERAIKWIDERVVHIQIAFDITKSKEQEQKRLEAELKLRQSQKMEAIGKLAGGVAHDLNNVLSGIINYPELILLDLPQDHNLREPLESIQASGEKAARIVNDLLTLARRGVKVNDVININKVIQEYLSSPEHEKLLSWNPKMKLEVALSDDLKMIKGSPVHLSKTIMNMVSNAAEAMPQGGNVNITTQNIYFENSEKDDGKINQGTHILLTISDEGVGISKEEQEKIFEPFYTKKVMGRSGTGLGMAVVWGTIEDHYGHIDIESNVGHGTKFKIYFPATDDEPEAASETIDLSKHRGKGEKILIVDDIKEQREIGKKMLQRLGYNVIAVASGEDAVSYMKNNSVALILLDMIMEPGISGLETYEQIIKFKPEQKTIIVSGFSESEDVKKTQKIGAGEYIHKPYNIGILAKAVRQGIDK